MVAYNLGYGQPCRLDRVLQSSIIKPKMLTPPTRFPHLYSLHLSTNKLLTIFSIFIYVMHFP